MTAEQVLALVEDIRVQGEVNDDDEGAHSREDDLWEAVLRAIADGAPNAQELASLALRTKAFNFHRWHS